MRRRQQQFEMKAQPQLQPPPEEQAAPRPDEEQLEHDATVRALRHELQSTAIHMRTLEVRRTKLQARLLAMGEDPTEVLSAAAGA
jgi:hypothetical protein